MYVLTPWQDKPLCGILFHAAPVRQARIPLYFNSKGVISYGTYPSHPQPGGPCQHLGHHRPVPQRPGLAGGLRQPPRPGARPGRNTGAAWRRAPPPCWPSSGSRTRSSLQGDRVISYAFRKSDEDTRNPVYQEMSAQCPEPSGGAEPGPLLPDPRAAGHRRRRPGGLLRPGARPGPLPAHAQAHPQQEGPHPLPRRARPCWPPPSGWPRPPTTSSPSSTTPT